MRCPLVTILLVAGSTVGVAQAAVVTSNPIADAFVDSAVPNNNYGGAGSVAVAAPGLPNGEFQSVLRFDTSGAVASFDSTYGAGQWTITGVTLRLTAASPNNAMFNSPAAAGQFAATWMANDGWTEGTGTPVAPATTGVTFATLPGFLGGSDESLGTYSFSGATSGAVVYTLGLTPGFTADLGAGGQVSLRLSAVGSTIAALWNSRNNSNASLRPELAITAVPAPSTILLLAGGAAIGMRRRRST